MRNAARRTRAPGVAVALRFELAVEQPVDAPVRRLLPDEALHLVGEAGLHICRQGLRGRPHRIDEELLADRKAHRQRIEERRQEGIAARPAPLDRGRQVDEQRADGVVGQTSPGPDAHRRRRDGRDT